MAKADGKTKMVAGKAGEGKAGEGKAGSGKADAGKSSLIIGTRGSALALTQSNMMADAMRKAHKGLDVRLEIIKNAGEADQKTKLHTCAGIGVVVKQ